MIISQQDLWNLRFTRAIELYEKVLQEGDIDRIRWFCRHDRYFLLTCILNRRDAVHPWIYDRCREVEAESDGLLFLWSRYHYKSTIITYAGSIQEILKDPEITIGIFSNVKALAEKCVGQIMRSLDDKKLYGLFPDILFKNPPRSGWSQQNGFTVKRKGNSKEPTCQGCGIIEGQPTGAHYGLRIYDDVVTQESVTTPDKIAKTTYMWRLSIALGTAKDDRSWYLGTRYHPNDTYQFMIDEKILKPHIRICTDEKGKSVLMSEKHLAKTRKQMGDRTYSCQMNQKPVGEGVKMFKDIWWHTLEEMPPASKLNRYIIVDGAKSQKKAGDPDFTCMIVLGLGRDKNYYILDGLLDRLNLAQRTRALFDLVEMWTPNDVFYEQHGAQCDKEHMDGEMDRLFWHFVIHEIDQKGIPKIKRIEWLVPLFEQAKIWFPARLMKYTVLNEPYDFVQDFYNKEFSIYPVVSHDDRLDNLANIMHQDVRKIMKFPISPMSIAEELDKGSKTVSHRDRRR